MKKLTTSEFILKSINKYGNCLGYDLVNYVNSQTKITLKCLIHNLLFDIAPSVHLSYRKGCFKCSNHKMFLEKFIEKASIIHNEYYDYSLIKEISSVKSLLPIKCPKHGIFYQSSDKHLNAKHGCHKCDPSNTKTYIEVINLCINAHGKKYNYDEETFKNVNTKFKIICNKHGDFWQTPINHYIHKQGCSKCYLEDRFKTHEDFVMQANHIHNNEYDYFEKYVGCNKPINIFCKKHQKYFQQLPSSHLKGSKCPHCKKAISDVEVKWLDYIKVPEEYRNKRIIINNKKYRVDAYNPFSNTVYEFYGDYWHGNLKIYNPNDFNKHNKFYFGELYLNTIKRQNKIISAGYDFIFIWESDFKKIIKESKGD